MEKIREKFCLSMLLLFGVCIQLKSCAAAVEGRDTLSLGTSITGNRTIISKNGTFELGFFRPNGFDSWYIGIWYANLKERTYVWVANREIPVKTRSGVLKLSEEGDLGLFDETGASIWSVNVTKKSSKAVILESGNFVMVSNKSETVWQSFDYPVNTVLPGMRFGGQQKLVSWKSSLDPSPGLFFYHLDQSGTKQFVLKWNNSVQYWRSGTWDGNIYSQIPQMANKDFYNISVEETKSGLYFTFVLTDIKYAISRYVLTKSGGMQLYLLLDNGEWSMFWSQPTDQCSVYGLCGAYGTCNSNNLQFCSCVEGFTPKDTRAWESGESWSTGCVRQSSLSCNPKNGSTDGFMELSVTLPDAESASSYPASTKKDCEKACFLNCSCTAFTFKSTSGLCQIWSGDLWNMRNSLASTPNSNVFIRLAASAQFHPTYSSKSNSNVFIRVALVIVGPLVVSLGVFSILIWRRHRWRARQRSMVRHPDSSDSFLRMYSYIELKIATRNFKSKLGSGGFGSVFKGHLLDGTPVAVKKMEGSRQDEKQFRAEISSLGKIQHANLVRLRGFCAQGSKRLLIYDYMPNGSLNSILFKSNSKCKKKVLDWETRFHIALGTARGLRYLHEECRDRIIHGDVKPENILLDNKFSPKLSDFGLAKLVGRDFSRVLTTTRGTRGYLAPEWISGLPITAKVDVYSFGMTLLEIISGRRNLDLNVQDSSKYYFPSWATTQIYNRNTMNIVEEGIAKERNIEEVRRVSIVGLLCIEKDEEVRPSMGQVVLMLEGKMQLQIQQIQGILFMERNANQSDIDSDETNYH